MTQIEHPDIEHVNRTGYTRQQWKELQQSEHEDEQDRSEWDDGRG